MNGIYLSLSYRKTFRTIFKANGGEISANWSQVTPPAELIETVQY